MKLSYDLREKSAHFRIKPEYTSFSNDLYVSKSIYFLWHFLVDGEAILVDW